MRLTYILVSACSAAIFGGCSGDDASTAGNDTGVDTGVVVDGSADTSLPTCAAFCDLVMTNCVDTNQQYISKDHCLNICAQFAPGTGADSTGDTLGCRSFHAQAAKTSAKVQCPQAGATGGGVCGDRCDGYCKLAFANCSTVATKPWPDLATCKSICKAASLDPALSEIDSKTRGNLNCMQYHLQASYEKSDGSSASVHCSHLTLASGPCAP